MKKLKPCPFCGREAKWLPAVGFVRCRKCDIKMRKNRWNTRADCPVLRKWSSDMADGLHVAFYKRSPRDIHLPGYITVRDGRCFAGVHFPDDTIDMESVSDEFLKEALFSSLIPWPVEGKDYD